MSYNKKHGCTFTLGSHLCYCGYRASPMTMNPQSAFIKFECPHFLNLWYFGEYTNTIHTWDRHGKISRRTRFNGFSHQTPLNYIQSNAHTFWHGSILAHFSSHKRHSILPMLTHTHDGVMPTRWPIKNKNKRTPMGIQCLCAFLPKYKGNPSQIFELHFRWWDTTVHW